MKKFGICCLTIILIFATASCGGSTGIGDAFVEPFLKLKDSVQLAGCSIKLSKDMGPAAVYSITPTGFDFDELNKHEYYMTITVTYDVHYKKDWNLGFGYLGSPKYEVSLVNSEGIGQLEYDLKTETTPKTRTISITKSAIDLKDTKITLTFSTDNIQNIIYFSDISVEYKCYK